MTHPAMHSPIPPPPARPEISMLAAANVVLRHRRRIMALVVGTVALVSVLVLLWPRSYTSDSIFMPQQRRSSSSLSGIASQLGISLPISDGAQSPAFYVDLLTSREILGGAVDTKYTYPDKDGRSVTRDLVEVYHTDGDTPALRRDAAIQKLKGDIAATAVQRTGVVTLGVTLRSPVLAQQVNAQLLGRINRFNMETRQSQASAERKFTERRVQDADSALLAAEDRLQAFLSRNRDYRNSPGLLFQFDRLQQDVTMRRTVYTTLSQLFEQARLEEVRDTPVITVVEQPEVPVRPDRRGLVVKALLAVLLALGCGIAWAFADEFLNGDQATHSSDLAEFHTLRREAVNDLLRPWRPFTASERRRQRARS